MSNIKTSDDSDKATTFDNELPTVYDWLKHCLRVGHGDLDKIGFDEKEHTSKE